MDQKEKQIKIKKKGKCFHKYSHGNKVKRYVMHDKWANCMNYIMDTKYRWIFIEKTSETLNEDVAQDK